MEACEGEEKSRKKNERKSSEKDRRVEDGEKERGKKKSGKRAEKKVMEKEGELIIGFWNVARIKGKGGDFWERVKKWDVVGLVET